MKMLSVKNVPWEMLGLLALIIALIACSYGLGLMVVKLFRKFKPISPPEGEHLMLVAEELKDSRFKIILVGWCVTAPLLYGLYRLLLLLGFE